MQASKAPRVELDKAREAIQGMKSARDLDAFEESWKELLGRLERVSNKIQAYYKKSPKWGPWWGPWNKQRKDDLLIYLTNARGADEHAVEPIMSRVDEAIIVTGPAGIEIRSIEFDGRRFTVNASDPFDMCLSPSFMALRDITNRDRVYKVPRTHFGSEIDSLNPVELAELGAEFYERMIDSAEAYFCTKS